MNTCEQIAALLDAYADGELTAEESAVVQAHLDDCPRCRAELEAILSLRDAFPSWEETEVPADFAQGVLDALPRPAKRTGGRRWWKTAVSLAACCAVLVLAVRVLPMERAGGSADAAAATAESSAATASAGGEESAKAADPGDGAMFYSSTEDLADAAPSESAAQAQTTAGGESLADQSLAYAEVGKSAADAVYCRWATVSLTAAQADRLLGDREPVSGGDGPVRYEFSVQDFDSILQKLEQEGLTLETAVEDAGAEGETCCLYVDLIY